LQSLKRLEQAWKIQECPLCGLVPGAPLNDYKIVWKDDPADLEGDTTEPQFHNGCGRQLSFSVKWLDIPLYEPGYFDESREDGF
jgi:hypothetical protein